MPYGDYWSAASLFDMVFWHGVVGAWSSRILVQRFNPQCHNINIHLWGEAFASHLFLHIKTAVVLPESNVPILYLLRDFHIFLEFINVYIVNIDKGNK